MYRKLAALARWAMPNRGPASAESFTLPAEIMRPWMLLRSLADSLSTPWCTPLFDVRLNESGELVVQPHASLIPLGAVIAAAPFAKRL